MKSFNVIAVVYLAVTAIASPVPQFENNDVSDFLRNEQLPVSTKVKRRIYEENSDRQLKQISLSSLIGDLEQGLFAAALSANKVLTDKNVNVPEIKPNDDSLQHELNKRNSINREESETDTAISTLTAATTENTISSMPRDNKVILQTTERVPESNGKPAHIVIDRIAIQPHTDGVAFIPTFELKHTVKDDNASKDREITKITIPKTEITSLANLPTTPAVAALSSTAIAIANSSFTTESSIDSITDSSTDSITITTNVNDNSTSTPTIATTYPAPSSTSTESSTTPKNIDQLKEAEEDLKEKVAEIEAEPIILSARV